LAENAATQMQSVQQAEIKRMQSLRNSNPNIREEEIDYLLSVTESMQDYIDGAQLKLDAIRIGVVVN
jgi:ATP-dependent helicase HepA